MRGCRAGSVVDTCYWSQLSSVLSIHIVAVSDCSALFWRLRVTGMHMVCIHTCRPTPLHIKWDKSFLITTWGHEYMKFISGNPGLRTYEAQQTKERVQRPLLGPLRGRHVTLWLIDSDARHWPGIWPSGICIKGLTGRHFPSNPGLQLVFIGWCSLQSVQSVHAHICPSVLYNDHCLTPYFGSLAQLTSNIWPSCLSQKQFLQ